MRFSGFNGEIECQVVCTLLLEVRQIIIVSVALLIDLFNREGWLGTVPSYFPRSLASIFLADSVSSSGITWA